LNIFKRIEGLENWLLSRSWNNSVVRKVMHIHVLGNLRNVKIEKRYNFNKLAVSVPECDNFEILKELKISKVNKAISYLRWVRNRFRFSKIKVDSIEASYYLKIWKNSYGIQKGIDRYII
jgi:hypothetical protein